MRIFLVQKCTRLKFAAKELHFFQIHKKNHNYFYIFSNRVENLVIKARFGNHGIVESRTFHLSIHLAGIWIQRKWKTK